MKKIINKQENLVNEMVDGLIEAYNGDVLKINDVNGIIKKKIPQNKIILLVGGGSGHEPIYHGLIGENMADAAAIGNIFTSPNPEIILETAKAANKGNGIIFLYGNYAGDNMNFDIASEILKDNGILTKTVRINDDVATKEIKNRRGISGLLIITKIAGAVCSKYKDIEEAHKIIQFAVDNTRSIGVALRSGEMLTTGKRIFDLEDDEIEIGMGIHGEPGVMRSKMKTADEITEEMMERIIADMKLKKNDEIVLLLNDLGATTFMELYIVNRRASKILKTKGIKIFKTIIGKFSTSMDMQGFSISITKFNDILKTLFNINSTSPAFTYLAKE